MEGIQGPVVETLEERRNRKLRDPKDGAKNNSIDPEGSEKDTAKTAMDQRTQ